MAKLSHPGGELPTPLSRERVLRAAIDLADEAGVESLSMRRLGKELGVEAMSLYHHVRSKDDILDGIADLLVSEIDLRHGRAGWKTTLRRRVISARKILLRHPWAPKVIESRTHPGPAMLRYLDSAIGILREAGFSVDLAHRAMHVLGSRVLGFTQDLYDDSKDLSSEPEMEALLATELKDRYPHLTEMAMAVLHEDGLGGCDSDREFEFAIDLILDGLERQRDRR